MKRVLFISSTGGHFAELMQLSEMFSRFDYHIITEKTNTNRKLEAQYPNRVDFLMYGTKDHMLSYPLKFLFNCFKSVFLYIKIRPQVIITTGTHTAVPMCYLGKLFGSKVIYIETFANITTKTLAGRMVYPIADVFLVQWEKMLELYPRAIYKGGLY